MKAHNQFRADLLAPALARQVLAWSGVPVAFRAVTLFGLLLLVVNGWGVGVAESPERLLTLRKTNLTTLVVWGLWWPAMIALAIVGGRAWCTVCPIELASRMAHAAGRHLGWARLGLRRWARAGWLVVLGYAVMQILVAGLSVHRLPHATSLVLIGLLGLSLTAGLFLREERAFCKTLCPAKALLSVYGRLTPVQLDVRSVDVCRQCRTLDCVSGLLRDRFDGRSCPSLNRPFARRPGDDCVLCLQCAKVCPSDNIGFGVVGEGASSRRAQLLTRVEALFVVVATGFVAHEVIGETASIEPWFHLVPTRLQSLAPAVGFGWWEALWFLGVFPFLLWAAISCIGWLSGGGKPLREVWLVGATAAAPVVAIAHLAKALAKISAWAGFLPTALLDPAGVVTLDRLSAGARAPNAIVGLGTIGWLILLALACVTWRSRRWLRPATGQLPMASTLASLTLAMLYGSVFVVWAWG